MRINYKLFLMLTLFFIIGCDVGDHNPGDRKYNLVIDRQNFVHTRQLLYEIAKQNGMLQSSDKSKFISEVEGENLIWLFWFSRGEKIILELAQIECKSVGNYYCFEIILYISNLKNKAELIRNIELDLYEKFGSSLRDKE